MNKSNTGIFASVYTLGENGDTLVCYIHICHATDKQPDMDTLLYWYQYPKFTKDLLGAGRHHKGMELLYQINYG